jgi:hypothetical protein
MTLTEHLTQEIQNVANVAGQPGQEEAFTEAYSRLLQEMVNAMTMMKSLALAQGAWLQGKAGNVQGAKWN